MTQTNLISTPEALQTLCTQLADSDWLTLDTEFLREKTYYAQLCLIQVANADSAVCIDAIALNTAEALQPLFDLLFDPNIVKVFHASSQDLEIFYQLAGKQYTGGVANRFNSAPLPTSAVTVCVRRARKPYTHSAP